MALITLANGTPISRNCASKMHNQCVDVGCQCACGCNVGSPLSNMSARRSTPCARGNHINCNKQSGAACPCYCHEPPKMNIYSGTMSSSGNCRNGYHKTCIYTTDCGCYCHISNRGGTNSPVSAPINIPPVSATTIPEPNAPNYFIASISSNMNYKTASAKLTPIATEIKKQMFLDVDIKFDFVGETVRDALFGSIVNKYVIDYATNPIAKIFIEKSLEQFKGVGNDYYKLITPFGDIKVSFLKDTDEPYWWSCDWYRFSLTSGITQATSKLAILESNKVLALSGDISKCNNPQEILEQGVKYAQQYGWTFEQDSIDKLANAIKKNQPLENTHELVIGFRAYNLTTDSYTTNNYLLKGNYGKPWETESLVVDCADFKQHVSDVDADWRGRPGADSSGADGKHDCGIYIYKDPSECLYHYGKTEGTNGAIALVYGWGVIAEFEKGYRAEKCKISRLWIWDKNKRLKDTYKLDQVVSGAKFTDFLYDPEVMQFAGRSEGT